MMDNFRPGPGATLDITDRLVDPGLMDQAKQNAILDSMCVSAAAQGIEPTAPGMLYEV